MSALTSYSTSHFSNTADARPSSLDHIDWSKVRGILLDFDGVFYTESEPSLQIFKDVTIDTLKEMLARRGHDLSTDNAILVKICTDSCIQHGVSINGLSDHVNELYPGEYDILGKDKPEFHDRYHKNMIIRAKSTQGFFDICSRRNIFYPAARAHCGEKVGILTHGSKEWAQSFLGEMNLQPYFDDDYVLGLENVGFKTKNNGPQPFEKVCDMWKLRPEEILFIDNSALNLRHPSDMGMQTIWIGCPAESKSMPESVKSHAPDLRYVTSHLLHWLGRNNKYFCIADSTQAQLFSCAVPAYMQIK